MYTVDDKYNDEDYNYQNTDDSGSWKENRGLIIKIIIICLCVIVLIWLIISLKKTNNNEVTYDMSTHNANVAKIRLAAEKYFFMDNLPKENATKTITLKDLKDKKLLNDITDSNNKVCSDNSTISMDNKTAYVMKIKLSCSVNEKEETFFYNKTNYKCMNCNGNTYMDGKADIVDNNTTEEYNCNNWSEWTTKRVNNVDLSERSRVMVKGVKYEKQEKVTYGEWTEFSETEVVQNENIEIETKKVIEDRWSEEKTTTTKVENSDKIKVISTQREGNGSYTYCPSGYTKQDGKCVAVKVGDLNYIQYNTYNVINKPCDDVKVEKNIEGKYETIYKSCSYIVTTDLRRSAGNSVTYYTYQELVPTEVTYYRFRTIKKEEIKGNAIYTDGYYEESSLPQGFEKLDGSEKIEYSYKLSSCEK